MRRLLSVLLLLFASPVFAAGEIQLDDPSLTGQTLYVVIKNASGNALTTGTTFATYTTTRGDFDQALTEVGVTGLFTYSFPAVIAGNYTWTVYQDANDDATPSHTDDIALATGNGWWNATGFGADVRGFDGVAGTSSGGRPETTLGSTYQGTLLGEVRDILGILEYGGVVAGGSSTSVTIDGVSSRATDALIGYQLVALDSATFKNEARQITASTYDGGQSRATLTVSPAFEFTPGAGDTAYVMGPQRPANFAALGINASGHVSRVTLTDTATALTEDVSGTVSAFLVAKGHSWRFDAPNQVTAPNLITEVTGFDDVLFEMDLSGALSNNASIASITTVTVTDITGTEPTVVSSALRADKKAIHIKMDGASATANTYTVNVTFVTTDSQTMVRKGRLVVQ